MRILENIFDARKGKYGYIHRKKLRLIAGILFFLLGIAGFLVIGFLTAGTRRNLLTVAAVLLVLPMAKLLVILIALWPFSARPKEEYDRVAQVAGNGVFDTELVITSSTEKTCCLDYCIVTEEGVLACCLNPRQDKKKIEKNLSGYLSAHELNDRVTIVSDYKTFLKKASALPGTDRNTCDESLLRIEGVLRGLSI